MKILDLSAGRRAMWFDKKDPRATFIDRRKEVNPDICCDTRQLPNYLTGVYDLIVFDPPHENVGANGRMAQSYGHSTRADIMDTIKRTASEAHRVSRPKALMAFKWNDKAWNLDLVLQWMRPYWSPIFGSHLRNQGGSSAKTQSFWVMLSREEA